MQQKQTIGDRIREVRKRLGLTQQQLAEGLSISRSAVAFYETDRTVPDMAFGESAHANGVDAWYIMTGERSGEAAGHMLDWDLLGQVLRGLRIWCSDNNVTLSTAKETAILQLLYKRFSSRGVVDQDFMEQTLALAA